MDLDLAGIFHLFLDLLGQVPGQDDHLVLADLLGLHHDADFAAGLDGIGLLHAGVAAGDGLQLFQALDVVLQVFAAGAGPGRGNSIRRLNEAHHNDVEPRTIVACLVQVMPVLRANCRSAKAAAADQ